MNVKKIVISSLMVIVEIALLVSFLYFIGKYSTIMTISTSDGSPIIVTNFSVLCLYGLAKLFMYVIVVAGGCCVAYGCVVISSFLYKQNRKLVNKILKNKG